MIGNIRVGDAEARSRDVIGRVYEYSLSQFASAEGTLAALRDTLLPKLISGEIRLEEAASIKRGGALMDHFGRLADHHLSIPIRPDEDGFTGRECPLSDCEGYFKVEFGTGLDGSDLACHCPYCGHSATHDHFSTREQIEYAKSVAMREYADAIRKDLKEMEFTRKTKGPLGFEFSLRFRPGSPVPIRRYREKELETEVVCGNCTLRYSVYGVFAFCPDCGRHNSLQIFEKSIEVVAKMVKLAEGTEEQVSRALIENALEDCVSVFDGFGRELCRFYARNATTADEWRSLVRAFQKRHLIAHRMGVVDEDYFAKASDSKAVVGRRIRVLPEEVRNLLQLVGKVARGLSAATVRQEFLA